METGVLSTGLEAIAVQQDKALGNALMAWVAKARAEYGTVRNEWSDATKVEFRDIIATHTGMLINIELLVNDNTVGAYFLHPYREHLLNGARSRVKQFGGVYADMYDWFTGVGSIDFKTGRVSGAFTTLVNNVFLCGGLVSPDSIMTVEEVVAAILHEIGHCFTSLSTIEYLVYTNYYLTDGIEAILAGDGRFETKVVDAAKVMAKYVTDDELMAVVLSGNATTADWTKVITMAVSAKRREQLGTAGMSERRDEQLADFYCVRQGYGRAMVTYAAKAFKFEKYDAIKTRDEFAKVQLMKTLVSGAFVGVSAVAGPVVLGIVVCLFLATIRTAGDLENVYYDRAKPRLVKIKNDMVFQLRQPGLTKSFRDTLVEDIKAIDVVIGKLNDYRTAAELVSNFSNPKYRSRYQRRHQEEQLENLLNNNLFVTALSRK